MGLGKDLEQLNKVRKYNGELYEVRCSEPLLTIYKVPLCFTIHMCAKLQP